MRPAKHGAPSSRNESDNHCAEPVHEKMLDLAHQLAEARERLDRGGDDRAELICASSTNFETGTNETDRGAQGRCIGTASLLGWSVPWH